MSNSGKYTRTVAFISQLSTIESATQMEALLQAYALPIGSSSIKRFSKSNLSVNGYVGLTAGLEYANLSGKTTGAFNWGLTSPIGISYTISICKDKPQTLTFFGSIIDIGSLVNQGLGNDTTIYTNLKIENFLSPGIGVYWNVPQYPLTIGVQYCYVPNFRTIKYENNGASIPKWNASVTRLNVSVLVDIPFFTLYNNSSKESKKPKQKDDEKIIINFKDKTETEKICTRIKTLIN